VFGAENMVDDVERTDVAIAVIGPRWLERDASGVRAIDDPNDYVHLELVAAMTRQIRIVQVRVAGGWLRTYNLPPPLRAALGSSQVVKIADDAWRAGLNQLVDAIVGSDVEPTRDFVEPPVVYESWKFPPSEPELDKPRYVEPSIASMLRKAAVAGVVPRPPATRQARRRPPAGRGGDVTIPPAKDAAPVRVLLRLAVPLALLATGAIVAAKWLLGWFVDDIASGASSSDTVVCTVFAPPVAAPGDRILVQAFAHLPEDADDARAIAKEMDIKARRRMYQSLWTPVPTGSRLDFELQMPGLKIDNPVQPLIWNRRAEAVAFGVEIPDETPAGAIIGTVHISLNAAPIGCVKFKLQIDRAAPTPATNEPRGDQVQRYRVAFISYASKDRDEVLARVQMLSAVGIRYFQDVLSLEPGDRWAQRLEVGIDDCDLFLLFWSSGAKQSEWVRREVRYALDRKRGSDLRPPEIRPVLLLERPIAEPWEELAHLHFNDRLLYFMSPRKPE